VKAEAKDYDPGEHADTFPRGTHVCFGFPANDQRGPVTLHWFDGHEQAPHPEELEAERKLPRIGAVVLGDKGGLTYGSHGAGGVRLFPEEKMQAYEQPEPHLPRVADHHQDWVNAVRSGTQAGSNFDYGGPLTEIALLGAIAIRMLGQTLEWDAEQMRFTNCEQANQLLDPPYRAGWTL
jgi:hypothetical protein